MGVFGRKKRGFLGGKTLTDLGGLNVMGALASDASGMRGFYTRKKGKLKWGIPLEALFLRFRGVALILRGFLGILEENRGFWESF